MRLDKFLANSGIGSRSQVKRLIKNKNVFVNNIVIKDESFDIDVSKDKVFVNNNEVRYQEFYYILLNKPEGYVSAVEDNVYPPILDLIEGYEFVDLFPIGRLDVDTTGVILLTNDGDLCHKLISPKYEVDKTYFVTVDKLLNDELVNLFKSGVELDDELTLPADLKILDEFHAELTIHQGKFHQVKRMFKKFGYEVNKLDRKSFAFLTYENLDLGEYRELTKEEETRLKELVNRK